ncbi:MAG: biotin/lipoyl-binding protein [Clostridia bacterium]|nr:biotin/lipoyl-binding protein [Clostridia bacterium]
MKKYRVKVNGVLYEIELEAADAAEQKDAPAKAAEAAPAVSGGATVSSPLPGTVLEVKAAVGLPVKKGDLLFVVEAMKMENEILAPCDGRIASVAVAKGASVESGAALCVIA